MATKNRTKAQQKKIESVRKTAKKVGAFRVPDPPGVGAVGKASSAARSLAHRNKIIAAKKRLAESKKGVTAKPESSLTVGKDIKRASTAKRRKK